MLWRNHLLEIGDDIEATFTEVPDIDGATRDIEQMSFEVTAVKLDFQRHEMESELLGYPA